MKALLVGILCLPGSSVAAEQALDPFVVQIDLRESISDLPSRPISLTAALDEALEENLDLALARADEQIAREGRYIADAALYPALEVGLFARRLDGQVQGSFGSLRDVAYSTYTGTQPVRPWSTRPSSAEIYPIVAMASPWIAPATHS